MKHLRSSLSKRERRRRTSGGWQRIALYAVGGFLGVVVAIQCVYPSDWLAPSDTIDGAHYAGVSRQDTIKAVEETARRTKIDVVFGEQTAARLAPTLGELQATIESETAVDQAQYSWWLRLVPSSIIWAHAVNGDTTTSVTVAKDEVARFVGQQLGETCDIAPIDASITYRDGSLKLVAAEAGGVCETNDAIERIAAFQPKANTENTVRVPMSMIAPAVKDDTAKRLLATIEAQLKKGVHLTTGEAQVTLDSGEVQQWIDVAPQGSELTVGINQERAANRLHELLDSSVAQPAGTVTITTRDFAEVSRSGGGSGVALDTAATGVSISQYLTAAIDQPEVATQVIEPVKKYIRTYSSSDTGLSALMKNYADDHPGTYGVSYIELSGDRRRAGYNEQQEFTTASTYKLFVAYSTLRRVESGELTWGQQISGGRNLEKCFDDMIVLSDNPCAEALVQKIGYRPLTNDASAIGATNTSFVDTESYKTTAGDLSLLLAQLETGQLSISTDNRTRLLGAMKRNVYRKGIPVGASGTVADKVGFLEGFLHDAAIVYSPKGTYVLTIMTNGSSWAQIADLTKEIEKIRG